MHTLMGIRFSSKKHHAYSSASAKRTLVIDRIGSWVKGTPLEPVARFIRDHVIQTKTNLGNIVFYISNYDSITDQKIVYALTPPARLDNIGDHAQVVGIKKWLDIYFDEYEVLEIDKDQVTALLPALQRIVRDEDPIFIHSGGNMNHRSDWSESARQIIIKNFPNNKITQLPQTVHYADNSLGREMLAESQRIYNDHDQLTIIARDPVSQENLQENFDAPTMVFPDFALMINAAEYVNLEKDSSGVMLCLRRDSESNLTEEGIEIIQRYVEESGKGWEMYDTTLDYPIPKDERETVLKETLNRFADHDLVITDRFHGMIFSVITKTPCIAIDTVDHKISSSVNWFGSLKKVTYVENINDIEPFIDEFYGESISTIGWEDEYFSQLAEEIRYQIEEKD